MKQGTYVYIWDPKSEEKKIEFLEKIGVMFF
jgi:hypothetical protein